MNPYCVLSDLTIGMDEISMYVSLGSSEISLVRPCSVICSHLMISRCSRLGMVFMRFGITASPIPDPDNFRVCKNFNPGFTDSEPTVIYALKSLLKPSSEMSLDPARSNVSRLKQKPSDSMKLLLN